MRKIKAKSFKPPRRFRPDKADVDFVFCARLRGEPVEPEENYFAEVTR